MTCKDWAKLDSETKSSFGPQLLQKQKRPVADNY